MSSSNNPIEIPEKILVIAKSARMLTRFLSDLGYRVVAIDCFGDTDTRQMAQDFCLVENLGLEQVRRALVELKSRHALSAVIYGSGFESDSGSLHSLQTELPVWGNSPTCFDEIQDKARFFRCLDELRIDYPPVAFVRPDQGGGQWLQKPLRGEGGLGIRRFNADVDSGQQGVYWQRYIEGEPLSVLFVAVADKVEIIGYQQQLKIAKSGQEFLFVGVISKPDFPVALNRQIEQWVIELSRRFGLRGLNGLDFIHDHGHCYVLEINARPPASLQLYGPEVMDKHVKAIVTGAIEQGGHCHEWTVYKVIYADQEILVGDTGHWPGWVVDRPLLGTVIGQGDPVCSIIARAKSRRQLQTILQHKQQQIEQLLVTGT